MSAIDIDRDAARDAAQSELGKPIYPRPGLGEQVMDWLNDLINRIAIGGNGIPGGWLTVVVLTVLLGLLLVLVVRVARRTMRTGRRSEGTVFDGADLDAAGHRAIAERAAAGGDWSVAIRHRLRAVTRHLEEASVLTPVPGRTATELARDAGAALPDLAGEFRSGTAVFNDVTYGGVPGTEPGYRTVADLDEHLRRRAHPAGGPAPEDATHRGWAQVR